MKLNLHIYYKMAPSDEPGNNATVCIQYEMWTKGILNKTINVSKV